MIERSKMHYYPCHQAEIPSVLLLLYKCTLLVRVQRKRVALMIFAFLKERREYFLCTYMYIPLSWICSLSQCLLTEDMLCAHKHTCRQQCTRGGSKHRQRKFLRCQLFELQPFGNLATQCNTWLICFCNGSSAPVPGCEINIYFA